jgi:hypothetical protein
MFRKRNKTTISLKKRKKKKKRKKESGVRSPISFDVGSHLEIIFTFGIVLYDS